MPRLRRAISSVVDSSYVPVPRSDIRLVEVGDEAVLVDGWDLALVLNATGAMIWLLLDGQRAVWDVARELADQADANFDEVTRDVAQFVERMGAEGVLTGYIAPSLDGGDEPEIQFVPQMPVVVGSVIAAVEGVDLADRPNALIHPGGGQRLLVKWNPHCGYCAAIAQTMVELRPALAAAGIELLLVCMGDVDERRQTAGAAARRAGIELPMLFAPDDLDPFPAVGTPSAYLVDGGGRVVSLPAHGAEEVPALAASLAGVELDAHSDGHGTTVRYLRRRGGMCAPDMAAPPREWASTRVYRIAGYHIGVRVDAETTGKVLDRLFPGARVHDDRAGHSYSVSLPGAANLCGAEPPDGIAKSAISDCPHNCDGTDIARSHRAGTAAGSGTRGRAQALNLFAVSGGSGALRTRDPGRVVQALLSQLDDDLLERDLPSGMVRVTARAIVIDGEAALLPLEVEGFQPQLQPVLARMGVALVDVSRPVLDLTTGSLVVEPPVVEHDPEMVARVSVDLSSSSLERPVAAPGCYPLRVWCSLHPGQIGVTGLTPAEAAATTVSSVVDTVDAAARVHQLGAMFASGRPRGLGIWYHDEQSFFAAVEAAVNWSLDVPAVS